MLDLVGVSGLPTEVGAGLRERNDFADRVGVVVYNETDEDALTDVVRAFHRAAEARP